jgi:cytoskeletal protein RodZ
MDVLSKLTDSFFPIIVLIVVVGVRIFTSIRRQVRNREQSQKREAGNPVETGVRGFNPWENRDTEGPAAIEAAEQKDPDDVDDAFSAWSLSVSDEEPVKPAPAIPSKPAELPGDTKNVSVFTALSSPSSVPVSGEVPAWLTSPSLAGMGNHTPETVGDDGSPNPPPVCHGNPVTNRIRSLPPLQQGLVWAEILGTPKGL